MLHRLTLTNALVVLLLVVGPHTVRVAPAQGKNSDSAPFAELRKIKKFVSVEVRAQGTAERIGLKVAELTDLTRLAFLHNFTGVSLEVSGGPSLDSAERPNQLGFINCEVWTVGEDYIVAYHLDCTAGPYLLSKVPSVVWDHAILGYGPKDQVPETIRTGLRTMIEDFAVAFFKARGESGSR